MAEANKVKKSFVAIHIVHVQPSVRKINRVFLKQSTPKNVHRWSLAHVCNEKKLPFEAFGFFGSSRNESISMGKLCVKKGVGQNLVGSSRLLIRKP